MRIDVSTLIVALLSSSVLGVLMKLVGEAIAFKRNRKAQKEDNAESSCACQTAEALQKLQTHICDIDQIIIQRTDLMNSSFNVINTNMETLCACLKEFLRDYIMNNANQYLNEGHVTKDQYNSMLALHEAYHKLHGNGILDEYIKNIKLLWEHQIEVNRIDQID